MQRMLCSLYLFLVVFIQQAAGDDFATIFPLTEAALATDYPGIAAQNTDLASAIDSWNCRRPYGYSDSSCTSKCFAYPRCPWNFDASCRNCTFHAYFLPRSLQALPPLKLSRQPQTEGRAPTQVTPAVLGPHWWKAIIGAFLIVLFIGAMTCLVTRWRKERKRKPQNQGVNTCNDRTDNRNLPVVRYAVSAQLITMNHHTCNGHAIENALNAPNVSNGYSDPDGFSAHAQEAPSHRERKTERCLIGCGPAAQQPSPMIPAGETKSGTSGDFVMPIRPVIPPPDYDVLKPATQSRTENVTRHLTGPV